jgi:hypothetical protein
MKTKKLQLTTAADLEQAKRKTPLSPDMKEQNKVVSCFLDGSYH